MLSIAPASEVFQNDQRPIVKIEYWNSPFTSLTSGLSPNDLATEGLRMDVREPVPGTGAFTVRSAVEAAATNAILSAFQGASGRDLVTDGRAANVVGYWSGGAPGHHGASVNRRVAYYFRGELRSVSERDWFSELTSPSIWFMLSGNGYFRLIKNGTTELFSGDLTERDYLLLGPKILDATTWNNGDYFELVYVQDREEWGGFVLKASADNKPSLPKELLLALQDAPIVGAGLFDVGTTVDYHVLPMVSDVTVTHRPGQAATATFQVGLVNPSMNDGIGWEWSRTDDPLGHLLAHPTGIVDDDFLVYRQRLVRIYLGFRTPAGVDELYPVFTGHIDDFENASTGRIQVTCASFEQRLADQVVKNYPDRISYQANGYRRLTGTVEPVYNVPAYDNWPMELVLRDLLVRAGVCESRMRSPLTVPQADGSSVGVEM